MIDLVIYSMKYLIVLGLLLLVAHPVWGAVSPEVQRNNLFTRIALCESQYNPLAKNPTSNASGLFQFLKGSWNYYGKQLWGDDFYTKNIFDMNDNTELAWYVFEKNGTADWESSRACWSSPLASG